MKKQLKQTLIIKRLMVIAGVFFLLLTGMIGINKISPEPTFEYRADACTRFCHNHGCRHNGQLKNTDWINSIYFANIKALKNNGLHLTYQQINLLVYVVAFPLISILLLLLLIHPRK